MFWKNFINLCNERNISPTAACEQLGYSNAIATKWKRGAVPRSATLHKIADHFGVSVDSLLYEAHETEDTYAGFNKMKMRPIPLYESVSAGFGVCVIDSVVGYVKGLYMPEAEAAETIAIKVTGDSMYPKIEDGDTRIVHKQTSVDSGAVAVLLLDGEEGLGKKVIYGNEWIELHSFNPIYPTRRFSGEEILRLQVLGLVKQVIKNM